MADDYTFINQDIGRPVQGYVLNSVFSKENQEKIATLQSAIRHEFSDATWLAPPTTLHITLMDWIAPLVDYGQDKGKLFDELFPRFDFELSRIIHKQPPIVVEFSEIIAAPGAIIIVGKDNGAFRDIRNRFLEAIELPPGTKQPPNIIHSTIARYRQSVSLESIKDFTNRQDLSHTPR